MRLLLVCCVVLVTSAVTPTLADWSLFDNPFMTTFKEQMGKLEESLKNLPKAIGDTFDDYKDVDIQSKIGSAWNAAKKQTSKAAEEFKDMLNDGTSFNSEPVVVVDMPGGGISEVESIDSSFFRRPNIFNIFGPRVEWWRGPNVCVTRKEINEETPEDAPNVFMTFQSTSCNEFNSSYVCTTKFRSHGISKTFTIIYQCCHGFYRKEGGFGCQEMNLKGLVETMQDLECGEFVRLISSAGLEDKVKTENITVFCPSNDAIAQYRGNDEENSVTGRLVRRNADLSELAQCHMLPGFIRGFDLVDEGVFHTEDKQCSIRTNVYHTPQKVITANCAKIISLDNHATNGIVHTIDRVMTRVIHSIGDIIENDRRFTIFKTLLNNAGLMEKLKDEKGQYTVFAPDDDAFRRMDPLKLRQLLNGESCSESIMKYHILPNVVCTSVIPTKARSPSLLEADVRLRRDDDGKLFINDFKVSQRDQMATNGVLNVIDGVLIPEEAHSITGILDESQLTDLVALLDAAEMRNEIDNMKNVTFFAPTNQAIQQVSPLLDELRKSPGKLRDILMFHIAMPSITMCHVDNNQQLSTSLSNKNLRFNQFFGFPFGLSQTVTVQCARIVERDRKACGATLQLVDRVLLPPEGDLLDVMSSNQNFSVARRLLRTAEMENELKDNGPFTILAPTDDAFYHLPEEQLTQLLNNKEQATEVMKNHILPEVLCCAGVQESYWMFSSNARTYSGAAVPLHRDNGGTVKIGGARVTMCDIMADNGVVHAVNRIISPVHSPSRQRHHRPTKHKDIYTVFP